MIHVSRNNIDLKDHLNNFAHAPHLKTLLLAVAAIMPVHHAAECLVNSHVVATTCDPAVWYTKYAPKQLTFWRTHLEGKKIAGSIMTMTSISLIVLFNSIRHGKENIPEIKTTSCASREKPHHYYHLH